MTFTQNLVVLWQPTATSAWLSEEVRERKKTVMDFGSKLYINAVNLHAAPLYKHWTKYNETLGLTEHCGGIFQFKTDVKHYMLLCVTI